jgi:hypothetical protein
MLAAVSAWLPAGIAAEARSSGLADAG